MSIHVIFYAKKYYNVCCWKCLANVCDWQMIFPDDEDNFEESAEMSSIDLTMISFIDDEDLNQAGNQSQNHDENNDEEVGVIVRHV